MPDFSRSPATWPRTLLAATGAATVLVTAGTGIWLAINSGDAPEPLFPRPAALSGQPADQGFAPAGPTPAATSPSPSATPSAHLGAVAGGLLGTTAPVSPTATPTRVRPAERSTRKPPAPKTPAPKTKEPITTPKATPRPSPTRTTRPSPTKAPASPTPDPCATYHDIRREYCYEILDSLKP